MSLRFGLTFQILSFTSLLFLQLASTGFALDNADELYKRGSEFMRVGNLPAALQELEKAAQLAPNNPKIYNMLGIVLTQLGRLEEANQAYGHALSSTPDFLPARKNRAVNAFTQRDFKFAQDEFEALVIQQPQDFVPHLFLGLLALEARDLPKARQYLLEGRQIAPYNGQLLLGLTRVYLMLGERESAIGFAREMRTQSRVPDSEKFDLGVVLAQFEANAEAAEVFQELWQKTPGSYDVGFNLALVQYRAGELAAALRVVDELSSKTTRPRAELLNLRGWIYNNMRKLDLARKSLEMAIATEPNNPDHYLDLSRVLYDAGETDAGIQAVSEGLQHSHDRDRLQVQMGLLYQKSGNYAEAENCYRHAQQSNSANRSAYLALANLMSAARRRKEALELLAKAIESLPGDFLLHYMYGGELLDSEPDPSPELLERTDSILKRALELNPFYANTHYLLGKLCLKKGDYDAARSYLEKACAFNPSHIGAYTQLGIIARHQGKKERATELAQIVQSLNEKADRNRQEILSNAVQESLGTQTSIKVK